MFRKMLLKTLCIILKGIYESLREMLAEIALQVEADIQVHGMSAHGGGCQLWVVPEVEGIFLSVLMFA